MGKSHGYPNGVTGVKRSRFLGRELVSELGPVQTNPRQGAPNPAAELFGEPL